MKTTQVNTVIRWRLKEVMKARRMNNRQLAKLIGLHEASISRLKAGVDHINVETLEKLCRALECKPADLIELADD